MDIGQDMATIPLSGSNDEALAALFATPPGALYLDTAAHGPRLRSVHAAAEAALANGVAPWRVSMDAWRATIERVRTLAADFFDGDADGVAMAPSVAHAMSTAARNLPLARGEAALVLEREFPSNLLPWQQRCADVGAQLRVARARTATGATDAVLDALERDPSIRILALSQAHWHDGALLDLDRIAPAAHARGAALVLDLSQSLGVLPAEVARWRPQFVAAVGHKWLLGGYGLGWLWVAPHWREHGLSLEQHWIARDPALAFDTAQGAAPYRPGARRFDAGGIAHAQQLAMAEAALGQLHAWGVHAVRAALAARTAAFDAVLADAGLATWSTPSHAPHLLGLRPPPERLDAVARALNEAGAVFTRRHGLLRIAPHLQVTVTQMRALARIAAAQR